MSRRRLIIAVALALSGLGTFAAIGLGERDSSRPAALDRAFDSVPAHPVEAPSASTAGSVGASAKGKPKVKYFETAAFEVPVAGTDVSTACPAKHKALTGYFLASRGIVLDLSAISAASARQWDYGLFNDTGDVGEAIVGVVCGKNL
jgi:hypothetical protein